MGGRTRSGRHGEDGEERGGVVCVTGETYDVCDGCAGWSEVGHGNKKRGSDCGVNYPVVECLRRGR